MRPVEIDVLRNNSASDTRQVPASGATIAISRQGATVTQSVTCGSSSDATVHVANSGRIVMGDIVTANASANIMFVKAVAADGLTLTVRNVNPSGASISLAVGDRLVCVPTALTATVAGAATCTHSAVTSVALRGPIASDSVAPFGDPAATLTVSSVASDNLSLALHNGGSEDIVLELSAPMLLATGYMLFVVSAMTKCAASATTTVPMRVSVLNAGVTVYPHGDLAKPLVVAGYDDSTRLLDLMNSSASDISLGASERLLCRATAQLSSDAKGAIAPAGNVATLDARGHARIHSPETRFDAIASGGGLTSPLLLADKFGGWARGGTGIINAKDYPTIQDAIDALPLDGGTVYIPAGTHQMTDTLYTPCDRPCHLVGEGCSPVFGKGTTLQWSPDEGEHTAMLRVRGDNSSVRGLRLLNIGTTVPDGTDESIGYGLLIGRRDVPDAHPLPGQEGGTEYVKMGNLPVCRVLIEDVTVSGAQGWGLTIPGFGVQSNGDAEVGGAPLDEASLSYEISVRRVRVEFARKYGALFVGGGCTTTWFEECAFVTQGPTQSSEDGNYYAYLSGCVQAVFTRCGFEGYSPTYVPWVTLWGAEDTQFLHCWFEEDAQPTNPHVPTYFLYFVHGCRGGSVRDCHFARDAGCRGYLKLIQIEQTEGARGLIISNPYAISGDESALNTSWINLAYADPAHIDLGGDQNTEIVVCGAGIYLDQARGGDSPPIAPYVLPIQYYRVPRQCTILGRLLTKVPEGIPADLDSTTVSNGNVMMDLTLPNNGVLTFFKAKPGFAGNWFLTNNAPLLDNSQRDARTDWSEGDRITNSDVGAEQVRTPSGWRLGSNVPTLSSYDRDHLYDWSQGDVIYNSDDGKLQVRIGSTWKSITLT
jgi:hypothetical protein